MIHTTFEREPGGRPVRGDVRMPDGPPPRTAVIVVHGFRAFKDWAFHPWIARRLVGDGHAVVSFNFSGSGIGPDLRSFSEPEHFATNTWTRELEELASVVDGVRTGELLPLRPRAVGLLGHGRGGADAVLHAAAGTGALDALVTWSAMARFDRWSEETRAEWRASGRVYVLDGATGRHMPIDVSLLEDFETNRERLDVVAAASRVALPWLVVHGVEDVKVAVDEARALVRAAPAARLHLVEGAGHAFGASHPLETPSSHLLEAERVTRRHFLAHLGDGAGRGTG